MTAQLRRGEFHGLHRETRTVAGLKLVEAEYEEGHRLPLHAHNAAFFTLVLRGAFSERVWRDERRLHPSALIYYPANDPHSEHFDQGGGRCFNVELNSAWMDRITEHGLPQPDQSRYVRGARVNWLAMHLYGQFREGGTASELAIEGLTLSVLADLAGPMDLGHERTAPDWLGTITDMIHAHFRTGLTLAALAHEVSIHPVHLTRVFRRFKGCSIGEYLRRLKIEYACGLLSNSGESLSIIAFAAGFSDQSHFTRRFKEHTGMSPGRFRKAVTRA